MMRNTKPLIRLAGATFAALGLMSAATWAVDAPGLDIIGFNGRGLFYGIEQFGLRPETKIPYSEIRIYDLRMDKEIKRSPFIFDLKEKIPQGVTTKQAIRRARDEVYLDARRVIRYLTLVPRGKAFTPADEKAEKTMFVSAPGLSGFLTLKTFPLPAPDCKGVKTAGYALTLTNDGGEQLIHKDKALPKSRGCPVDYTLARATIYLPNPDMDSLAVVIAAHQGGKHKGQVRYTVTGHIYDHRKKK